MAAISRPFTSLAHMCGLTKFYSQLIGECLCLEYTRIVEQFNLRFMHEIIRIFNVELLN